MKSRISRRNFLKASALTGSGLAIPSLVGLGGHTFAQERPGNMASDQVLRMGYKGETTVYDPAQSTGYGGTIVLTFLPLFELGLDMSIQPGLCTSYEVSDDGTVYRLNVHPDATWSDGTALTAQDIADWMVYVTHPEGNPGGNRGALSAVDGYQAVFDGESREFAGISATDDKTLRIELTASDPLFWYNVLVSLQFSVAKAEQAFANPTGWWLDDPIYNGPFELVRFDRDALQFAIERAPNYWGPAPLLERIEWASVLDGSTLGLLWENDEIDLGILFAEQEIEAFQSCPACARTIGQSPFLSSPYMMWVFNMTLEPTDDIMVRRALTHAVDQEAMVNALFSGTLFEATNTPMRGLINESKGALSRYADFPTTHDNFVFDPELAREELAQSRYGSAENLPTIAMTPSAGSGDRARATEIVAEFWREHLGITDVDIRPSASDFGEREEYKDVLHFYRTSGGVIPDAAAELRRITTPGFAGVRMGGWSNQEFIDLVDSAYLMDRDSDEYVATVQQAEDVALADYPYVPMWNLTSYHWVKPNIANLDIPYNGFWYRLGRDVYRTT